jgi:hemerythrin-like domain-containing protein
MKKNNLLSKLDQVIGYIDELGTPSVVDAIKADHDDLRKFIGVLKSDRKALATKKKAYKDFSSLLKSHSSSEEKAVYAKCLRIDTLKKDGYEGYVEHALAEKLMREIDGMRGHKAEWQAKAKVLAELVEHHMDEEERDLLPALRSHVEAEERQRMREDFVNRRIHTQRTHTEENAGVLNANV